MSLDLLIEKVLLDCCSNRKRNPEALQSRRWAAQGPLDDLVIIMNNTLVSLPLLGDASKDRRMA